jgi:hypothetical protein
MNRYDKLIKFDVAAIKFRVGNKKNAIYLVEGIKL